MATKGKQNSLCFTRIHISTRLAVRRVSIDWSMNRIMYTNYSRRSIQIKQIYAESIRPKIWGNSSYDRRASIRILYSSAFRFVDTTSIPSFGQVNHRLVSLLLFSAAYYKRVIHFKFQAQFVCLCACFLCTRNVRVRNLIIIIQMTICFFNYNLTNTNRSCFLAFWFCVQIVAENLVSIKWTVDELNESTCVLCLSRQKSSRLCCGCW